MSDLNCYQLINDGNFDVGFSDNSVTSDKGVAVYFRNVEKHLINYIKQADAIFGAVAWLTSFPILDAMAKLKNVSIIVQKEDFLRPDINTNGRYEKALHKKYNALKCNLTRYSFSNILSSVSISSDPFIDPVRCVGNHNFERRPAFPRMHNKFIVFARIIKGANEDESEVIIPYAVWTGSFNLTKNATMSLENALYITDMQIVNAYFQEYGQIAAMSEELDWTSVWTAPQWRIGT